MMPKKNWHLWTESPAGESQPLSDDLAFTGRVYIYYDNIISDAQKFELEGHFRSAGLEPTFRGFNYLQYQRKHSPPIVRKTIAAENGQAMPFRPFDPDPSNEVEPSMLSLFMTGFKGDGKGIMTTSFQDLKATVGDPTQVVSCRVLLNIHYDRTNNAKHLAVYVPSFPAPDKIALFVASNFRQWMKNSDDSEALKLSTAAWTKHVIYDEKVYLYIPAFLNDDDNKSIADAFAKAGAFAEIRTSSYWAGKVADVRAGTARMPQKYELVDGLPKAVPSSTDHPTSVPSVPVPRQTNQ